MCRVKPQLLQKLWTPARRVTRPKLLKHNIPRGIQHTLQLLRIIKMNVLKLSFTHPLFIPPPPMSEHPTICKWRAYLADQARLLGLIEQNTAVWSSVNRTRANVRALCRGEPSAKQLCPSSCASMEQVLCSIRCQDIDDGVDACRQILLGAPGEDGHVQRLDRAIDAQSEKIKGYISTMECGLVEGEAELVFYENLQHAVNKLAEWTKY